MTDRYDHWFFLVFQWLFDVYILAQAVLIFAGSLKKTYLYMFKPKPAAKEPANGQPD